MSHCKACHKEYSVERNLTKKAARVSERNKSVQSEIEKQAENIAEISREVRGLLAPRAKVPKRKYYLHQRNGIFYVEMMSNITGKKMTAKSTGKETKEEAIATVENWLLNGIPARGGSAAPVEYEQTVDAIIWAIRKIKLTPQDTMRIAAHLTREHIMPYSDLATLLKESMELKEAYEQERKNYKELKNRAKAYFVRFNGINPSISDDMLAREFSKLQELKMQHILLQRRIRKIKQGANDGKEKAECGRH